MISILKIYTEDDLKQWDEIVKSFINWDIYYLCAYLKTVAIYENGSPLLITYSDELTRFCYAVIKKDIAKSDSFKDLIPARKYYDLETPYGYGWILTDGELTEESQNNFLKEFAFYCHENGIVSQFLRGHPFLKNQINFEQLAELKYMHDTVYMDLSSKDNIWKNMSSNCRRNIRKAIKSGVTLQVSNISDYKDFMSMYLDTMNRNQADKYYFFDEKYFESLCELEKYTRIFYAIIDGKKVSGEIIFFNNQYMHYHLGGTDDKYRSLGLVNYLQYMEACWGSERNIKVFHLGGGMTNEDELFRFKKQFNKNGCIPFYVGRNIFDKRKYDDLIKIRKAKDSNFDDNNNYMIQYRKP